VIIIIHGGEINIISSGHKEKKEYRMKTNRMDFIRMGTVAGFGFKKI
jgi:hypothetical protein